MRNDPIRFSIEETDLAAEEWGFNCGPGALCAILDMTPEALRPRLLDFESKGYMNPTLMYSVLNGLGVRYKTAYRGDKPNPMIPLEHGLMRVQWAGPWTDKTAPFKARYRYTHWIGVRDSGKLIFDVNAVCCGGWIDFKEWSEQLVPWLLKELHPRSYGFLWPTHAIEIISTR